MRPMVCTLAIALVSPAIRQTRTQVVLLATGTPRPDPERSGPATAIVVDGTAYLVDIGPGIVRRAAAAFEKGIPALAPDKLQTAFVTHSTPITRSGWSTEPASTRPRPSSRRSRTRRSPDC